MKTTLDKIHETMCRAMVHSIDGFDNKEYRMCIYHKYVASYELSPVENDPG